MNNLSELIAMNHADKTGFSRHYMMLYSVVLGMESKRVFEFGTGYSSKAILMALEATDGMLISCDYRPLHESCMHYFQDQEEYRRLSSRWKFLNKRSSGVQDDIDGEVFDVVLHDGSHTWREVANDLRMVIPQIKKGGILLLHDTCHPTDNYQLDKSIDAVDSKTSNDGYHIERVTLPYGYGLTIVSILEDFGNGEVDIKWRKKS